MDSAARSQTDGTGGKNFFCDIVQASPLAELTQCLTITSKKTLCLDNQTKAPFLIPRQHPLKRKIHLTTSFNNHFLPHPKQYTVNGMKTRRSLQLRCNLDTPIYDVIFLDSKDKGNVVAMRARKAYGGVAL